MKKKKSPDRLQELVERCRAHPCYPENWSKQINAINSHHFIYLHKECLQGEYVSCRRPDLQQTPERFFVKFVRNRQRVKKLSTTHGDEKGVGKSSSVSRKKLPEDLLGDKKDKMEINS